MSNVQEALNEAIEMITILCNGSLDPTGGAYKTVNQCKAALVEIEKCEPLEINGVLMPFIPTDQIMIKFEGRPLSRMSFEKRNRLIKDYQDMLNASPLKNKKVYTSPQPRDWVQLTDEQAYKCISDNATNSQLDLVRDVEAKCKQLNTKG